MLGVISAKSGDYDVAANSPNVLYQLVSCIPGNWYQVILLVNENGTAEKFGINQNNPPDIECIFVLVSYKPIKPCLSSFESTKTLG